MSCRKYLNCELYESSLAYDLTEWVLAPLGLLYDVRLQIQELLSMKLTDPHLVRDLTVRQRQS